MTVVSKVLSVLATKMAVVKRAAIVNGKRGLPVVHLTGLSCTQLFPPSAYNDRGGLMLREAMNTPHTSWDTFVMGTHDIRQGDLLEVDGKEYTIRGVQPWEFPRSQGSYMQLSVEEVKS